MAMNRPIVSHRRIDQLKAIASDCGFSNEDAKRFGKLSRTATWEALLETYGIPPQVATVDNQLQSLDTSDNASSGLRVLGLDVCKSSVVACLLTRRPTQPREAYHSLEFFKLNADAAGIKQLLALKPDVAVMEPTGVNYQRLWGTKLAGAGVEVRLVSNNKLPSYRKTLDLPDKDDDADALALACYFFDYQHLPRRFLQVRDAVTVRVRECCLRLCHYNRVQSPIINRLRQDLAWQFPEVMNVRSILGADDNLPPLLWGWIAGERNSAKYDRLYDLSVGSGLTDECRFAAKMYCDLAIQERVIETELSELIKTDMRFLPYRKVFARFGFGVRTQGIILSQIFPIQNFFGEDNKPEIATTRGRNSKKATKKRRSEARFMKSLGVAPVRQWSGDERKKSSQTGSDVCRKALWQWIFTRIEPQKNRPTNPTVDKLVNYFVEAKNQKQPIRLVRSRLAAKAARALWRELVAEIVGEAVDTGDTVDRLDDHLEEK
jgi:transposase